MKRAVILLLIFTLPLFAQPKFFASKKSTRYHIAKCDWAKQIASVNLRGYKTRAEAKKAGLKPCKVCDPDSMYIRKK
jgi:methylphosphotriester-DNA--protein-cysteine methyltransferase